MAALKIIASQNGLDYVASQAVKLVSNQTAGQAIPEQSGQADKVKYWLRSMTVRSFTPPKSSVTIQPGQGLTWSLVGADLNVHGDWKYEFKKKIIKIKDSGSFDVSAKGIGITFSIALGESAGKLTVNTTACSSTIGDLSVKFHGGASWIYNIFSHYVEKSLKESLKKTMCAAATKAVDVDLAKQLAEINWTFPVENILELDYSLVAAPKFEAPYLATSHKGEVYWAGDHTETPFQPAPFPDVEDSKMLTLLLSDYVVNSLAYVLQQHGLIKHTLTNHSLPEKHKNILQTSSQDICIGSIIPQLREKYPDLSVELDMATTQAPTMNIAPDGLRGTFVGTIDYYVRLDNGSRAFLFSTDLKVTSDLVASCEDMTIKFKVTELRPEIKVTNSDIGSISDLLLNVLFKTVSTAFLKPKLNKLGERGLELPKMKGITYVNPSLEFIQGALMLSTDLEYDPEK